MARALTAAIILFFITGIVAAQNPVQPRVTGFAVMPAEVNQCRPARITFHVANETDKTIYSQRPYAGATYNLYHTFKDKGIEPLPDRYTVGISLNSGLDGYPYRWGFRGPLAPGRSVNMMGFLSLIEVGPYNLTVSMLLGDTPIGATSTAAVNVQACEPDGNEYAPMAAKPIYPIIHGRRLPPMRPFVQDGYLMVAVRPFVYTIGGNLYFIENSVVISRPGLEIVLVPGSREALVNGMSVIMPVPVYMLDGITYAPIRYLSPLLGETFYWYPDSRALYIYGAGMP